MGASLSRINNKLSFDYAEYLREKSELSFLLRSIATDSAARRKRRGVAQATAGVTSVAAGIAGAVAAAPATLGLSLPAAAVATAAVVGNSMTAASVASSAASFGHGYAVDRDIVRRLENLEPLMSSMSRKDAEVDALVKFFRGRGDEVFPAISELQDKLSKKVSFNEGAKANGMAAWSVLSPGTYGLVNGSKQFKSEEEFEKALTTAADSIDEKTAILRSLEGQFSYVTCVPAERRLSRGRLTYIDCGGGCSRFMKVTCSDRRTGGSFELESDSTNTLRLPEGASNVKVTFHIRGGGENKAVRKVDRASSRQPWVKSAKGKRLADVLEFEDGDGVDAVFCVKGPMTHSFVHKAWDFGRDPLMPPREWEWWGENAEEAWKDILPDSEERSLRRTRCLNEEPLTIGSCGSCQRQRTLAVEQTV
uniref:Uncharacterized protein n=1 Tax=Pseudictyota dubia TaxID=2749911 RepID=A0A7R9WEU0_9STRA|mmetsp:Transcript_45484/g.84272  ORF Transcript_45484/g.84272 Transcript_45484/m.84272 type:complete len:421 (+) Transcript_45484:243-1505(+)|eukprot:CAMPEP_0197449188 /NCGR_PEP_ID=MMETSP1175-20131217/20308_1 /TAXON_ID=1003142 /ORGANISM="Triceratium dubium, Strain CCMP147" /LENGTH=420 /DNA_ID=CAMNT_0042981221 /DNA_START=238 /DNA_END=1500 /DNA_ORIENTATION=+